MKSPWSCRLSYRWSPHSSIHSSLHSSRQWLQQRLSHRARVGRALTLAFVALCVGSSSLASAAPAAEVYSPADVVAGQKAYGLTVFVGDKVEKFDLILLGTLKNYLGPKQDLVVCKLTDPKLELAGVVSGMSGSPIYVDGKLLGALGYAMGAFMREGICGITPISAMREVRDLPVVDPFTSQLATPRQAALGDGLTHDTVARAADLADYGAQLRPIASPLMFAGVDPRVVEYFAPRFERLGYMSAPGGMAAAAAGGGGKGAKVEAGGAIAAQLVRGDLSIAATGTITSVDGNKLLAFGHPFLGAGAVSFPMATSRIVTIVPSLSRSFKMGEVVEEVGAFTQDRLTAIAGELGRKAALIPVEVEVQTQPEGRSQSYKFEIARDPRLTPELVQMALANAMLRRNDSGTAGTVELNGEIELSDGNTVKLGATMAMERDPMLPILAAIGVARPFSILWSNDFGPPLVKRVKAKAVISHEVRRLRVDYVSVRQSGYRPGEAASVEVGLKPDDGVLRVQRFEVPLPASMQPGEYELAVGGAVEANQVEFKAGGALRPQSHAALVDALQSLRQEGPLFIQLIGKGTSVRYGEALLSDVPLSFAAQVAPRDGDGRASKTALSLLHEQSHAMRAFVFGEGRATLKVRSPR